VQDDRVSFLGCPIDLHGRAELLRRVETAARGQGARLRIEGLNVAKLVDSRSDPELLQALREAEIVHADGQGIVLGLAGLGLRAERCAGIDVMQDICERASRLGLGVYLLGARTEIVAAAARQLQERWPSLVISGWRNGYFTETEEDAVVDAINASGAAFLFIGISSPKKELFLRENWNRLAVRVAMGVGGAFDVISGHRPRAPLLMQRAGLEWFFRLCLEPRRLALRYFRTNIVYAWLLATAWFGSRIAEITGRLR
jgi:N-acetylglucosaminyldiphosphoundecaprenol N-acetyl-beta-D-mannosaminyltransferase